jgi:hypothetical protein
LAWFTGCIRLPSLASPWLHIFFFSRGYPLRCLFISYKDGSAVRYLGTLYIYDPIIIFIIIIIVMPIITIPCMSAALLSNLSCPLSLLLRNACPLCVLSDQQTPHVEQSIHVPISTPKKVRRLPKKHSAHSAPLLTTPRANSKILSHLYHFMKPLRNLN